MDKKKKLIILGLVFAVLALVCFVLSFFNDADQNWFFLGVACAAIALLADLSTNKKRDKKEEEDKRFR